MAAETLKRVLNVEESGPKLLKFLFSGQLSCLGGRIQILLQNGEGNFPRRLVKMGNASLEQRPVLS